VKQKLNGEDFFVVKKKRGMRGLKIISSDAYSGLKAIPRTGLEVCCGKGVNFICNKMQVLMLQK